MIFYDRYMLKSVGKDQTELTATALSVGQMGDP